MKNILWVLPWNRKTLSKKVIDVYIIDYGFRFEARINHGQHVEAIAERPLRRDELTKFKIYKGLTISEMNQTDMLNGHKLMKEIMGFPDLSGRINKTEMYTREEVIKQITSEYSLKRYFGEIGTEINYHHVTDEEFERLISPSLPKLN